MILRAAFSSPGSNRILLRNARAALDTLAQQYGGTFRRVGRTRFRWTLADGTSIDLLRKSHPTISMTVPLPAQHSVTFQRIPRLLFAFVDSFIAEGSRIGAHPYLVTTDAPDVLQDLRTRPDFLRLFESLSKHGYSVHLGPQGLRAWKRLAHSETNDIVLYEQLRLLRDFGRVCAGAASLPIQSVAVTPRCAYCHEEAPDGEDLIHCASCATPHHQECFELNGRCSVFGCGSARPAEAVAMTQ